MSAFVAELRHLSEYCAFGDNLDDMLRDRLVCGVLDGRLQRNLLAKTALTFKEAFELALAAEAAARDSNDLQAQATPSPATGNIHAMQNATPYRAATREPPPRPRNCHRCGGRHLAADCRFKDAECHFCHKKGHLAKVCRNKALALGAGQQQGSGRGTRRVTGRQLANSQQTLQVLEEQEDSQEDDSAYAMFAVKDERPDTPYRVTDDRDLELEVDTGATTSIISSTTYNHLWPTDDAPPLQACRRRLFTYTGEALNVAGAIDVTVRYGNQQAELGLVVVTGDGPSLLGRDWLRAIRLDWASMNTLRTEALQNVLKKHESIFKDELGLVKDAPAKLFVDPSVPPKFCKPRTVPYALREKVDLELQRLQDAGIIEPVQFAEWAAPIVPVLKGDGSVRICGDYKSTVNRAAKLDTYPIPRIEDLLASLAGGTSFTKLDLADAYLQVPLDEEAKRYVVINTQKGLFRYNRLPFGVASAPSIFQRTMKGILRGIKKVCVYIDDILITGSTEQEHLEILSEVFTRLEDAGLRLKRSKCYFLQQSVEYLGHRITSKGIVPTEDKVRAIKNAPAPENVPQLRSFLGLVNYYSKFFPQLATLLAPLHKLLQKKTTWLWGPEQQKSFEEAKSLLTSSSLLVHFDPDRSLVLSCDASPYGVGAVLSHSLEDGSDQPIAYASRSLAPAEKKYAQVEKEALAIVFGIKKFHHYLFGREFTVLSDHQPLQHIFSASRPVPTMASARIQRWALTLSAYKFQIRYKPGKDHANADGLSRLPLSESPASVPTPAETVLLMDTLQGTPVTAKQIRYWTDRDCLLSTVKRMVLSGWQDSGDEELLPFIRRKDELSVQEGCLLWGNRVVIPKVGRQRMMEELHQGHPGETRMKSLARSVVWWPGMDAELEGKVKNCLECQRHKKSPASAPLHPWEWPKRPCDFIENRSFVIPCNIGGQPRDTSSCGSVASEVNSKRYRPNR